MTNKQSKKGNKTMEQSQQRGMVVVHVDPSSIKLTSQLAEIYDKWSYTSDEARRMEAYAIEAQTIKRDTVNAMINLGEMLNDAKKVTPRGNFGEYVANRCGLSHNTANRIMAASDFIKRFPQLMENAENFDMSGLYVLGQSKALTDDNRAAQVVHELMDTATHGAVGLDEVRSAIEKVKPVQEGSTAPRVLPYRTIDAATAQTVQEQLVSISNDLFMRHARTADLKKTAKNKEFKEFVKEVSTNPEESPFMEAVYRLLVTSFVARESAVLFINETTENAKAAHAEAQQQGITEPEQTSASVEDAVAAQFVDETDEPVDNDDAQAQFVDETDESVDNDGEAQFVDETDESVDNDGEAQFFQPEA